MTRGGMAYVEVSTGLGDLLTAQWLTDHLLLIGDAPHDGQVATEVDLRQFRDLDTGWFELRGVTRFDDRALIEAAPHAAWAASCSHDTGEPDRWVAYHPQTGVVSGHHVRYEPFVPPAWTDLHTLDPDTRAYLARIRTVQALLAGDPGTPTDAHLLTAGAVLAGHEWALRIDGQQTGPRGTSWTATLRLGDQPWAEVHRNPGRDPRIQVLPGRAVEAALWAGELHTAGLSPTHALRALDLHAAATRITAPLPGPSQEPGAVLIGVVANNGHIELLVGPFPDEDAAATCRQDHDAAFADVEIDTVTSQMSAHPTVTADTTVFHLTTPTEFTDPAPAEVPPLTATPTQVGAVRPATPGTHPTGPAVQR